MKVFLDDTELQDAGLTLSSALDAGKTAAQTKERVIVEVWADGERTSDDEIAQPPTFEPYADELRMVSAVPAALVVSTLYDASDAMPQVQKMQIEAAGAIHRGDKTDSMQQMQSVLSIWESVRRAIEHGCALLGVSPSLLLEDETRFETAVSTLGDALRALVEAAKQDDWVTVADTLEDELHEQASVWQALLCDLADAISKQGAPGS